MKTISRARIRKRHATRAKQRQRRNIAIGLIILATVGWIGWQFAQSRSAPVVELVDTVGAQVGQAAPDFSVPTLDGGKFTLTEHRGRPAVVFVMAYWCTTCFPEARALARLHEEYGDRVSIVALDVDPGTTPQALAQFKAAVGDPGYTWAFDTGQRVAASYQIAALDTTLVINQGGHVVYRDEYPTAYATLKTTLDAVLEPTGD